MIRRSLPVAATLAGAALCVLGSAPAFATTTTTTTAKTPTAVTIKAAKSSAAPSQKVLLTSNLKAGSKLLAGETLKLEKRASGTTRWSYVSSLVTNSKGHVSVNVVPGKTKGHKEQYEFVFAGTSTYKASHSAVVTLTVS